MKIKNIFRIFAIILIFFAESIYSHAAAAPKIMLGIDVLESMGFKPIAGKRVGLLTHPAGVNRYGKSTIDILNSARNVNLCALFGPEHGIYGNEKADVPVLDKIFAVRQIPQAYSGNVEKNRCLGCGPSRCRIALLHIRKLHVEGNGGML